MARNYRRSYFSKKSFRRNKLTLSSFFTYWILPTLGYIRHCYSFDCLFCFKRLFINS
ncbi:hypothetical protein HGD80_02995 [Paulownia witches'-broom phytoplasma]|uniref:Uncharacterized protein n=1 Tax=Paulownia witches'-broom phytoplasma TaxID=39647 RepID=A0ABX8TQQ9_9MOLU|nr:hypothetical protein [Paulownia witches'-broom phytoplasma]QYC31431.1 hypothetical protein HGD80_02995 [Paulownia witches'-broom phytoplasma]